MQINNVDSIQSNGGAVSNKTVGTAFIAVGCVTSGVWSLGSHVHTLVAAPVVSLGALGTAGALAATGIAVNRKQPIAAKQTVDTTATAVA
jgi:hypothetical protein